MVTATAGADAAVATSVLLSIPAAIAKTSNDASSTMAMITTTTTTDTILPLLLSLPVFHTTTTIVRPALPYCREDACLKHTLVDTIQPLLMYTLYTHSRHQPTHTHTQTKQKTRHLKS